MSSIGTRMTHIRASLSQRAFADQIGVPLRTYQTFEQDKREPDLRTLTALHGMGWSIDWLLTGEGPERLGATNVAQTMRLDPTILGQAIGVLLGVLEESGGDLTHSDFGQAVLKIYDGMQGGSRSLPQIVADLVEYRNRNRG